MGKLLSRLYVQLLIGIGLGIAIGYFWPDFGSRLRPVADLFIKLIRMVLAPIIFGTIVTGIARMGDLRKVGRVGIKALVYFEVVSGIALVMGLVVVNVFHPGSGMNIQITGDQMDQVTKYAADAKQHGMLDFFLNIVPTTMVGPFSDGTMLQVIFVSVLFGIGLSAVPGDTKPFIQLIDTCLHAFFAIVRIIMRLAPLAALGAMAFAVGKYHISTLRNFAELIACLWGTSLLFVVGVLGPIARYNGISLWKFLKYIRDEFFIVLGTWSTEAVLPQMLVKLEDMGCQSTLVGMVLPTGYMFNADGTSIYLAMAAIFVAQATNTHLSLADQLLVLAVLVLTSKGSAGVAGAGFVTLAATLSSMNKIPIAGLALLLGVESFLNAARALTNLIGNGIATVVVARWENQFDPIKADAALNGPASVNNSSSN
jgi:DAACS family dicarboxylate/amino acid:cation (Na+ or H+) symporter/aerobic C4-dicarboxylate transport protein